MPDFREQLEEYFKEYDIDIEGLSNISYQLQKNNDILQSGLKSCNVSEFRNTYVINAQDSLDDTYSMYTHFNIIDEMTKIVSIKLSFWLLPFRAYSTAVPSGGAETSGAVGAITGSRCTTVAHNGDYIWKADVGGAWFVLQYESGLAGHTHSTPAHVHALTFGIYEEDNSPTIGFQISRDNGKTYGSILGKYTDDVENLEIKDYITASGSYIIKFTSTARARLSVQATVKLDIKAR